MEDWVFVQRILKGDPIAQEQFAERYSNYIIQGLLRKCKWYCINRACPIRFGLTQHNLERTRCDELANLYVFSLESLSKALKSYCNSESLDTWIEHQTNPNGLFFRQRFAAYMAKKYPITGRARIPDRFRNIWSSTQKKVYKFWLRQGTASDIAVRLRLPETEVIVILEDILFQLREAGLLASLQEGVQLENFQQRERIVYESEPSYAQKEQTIYEEQKDESELLENDSQFHLEVSDELFIETLKSGVEVALSDLSRQERRLLMLKFDAEWTLQAISKQCDTLGLDNMTEKQVGHAIDSILRKMLPIINRILADVDDVDLKLPALKKVLLEWGIQE